MDGWLLSTRTSLYKSIAVYGNSEDILYEGSLIALHEKFSKKYSALFKKFKVKSYDDFITQIKKKIDVFSFVGVSINKEYENRRYLKKNNIEEVRHHLKKNF